MALEIPEPGRGGYRILLFAIVALLVVRPLIADLGGKTALATFSTLVLLAGVWAVSKNRNQLVGLAVLALLAMSALWGWAIWEPLSFVAATVFFFWIAVILGIDVFADREAVTADMIYGGINIYLLIGLSFAAAFSALATLQPESFTGLQVDSIFGDAIYFSFVTITTLGYGDIAPTTDTTRMLSAGEAVLGQLYIAVLLARLVAVYISNKG